MSKVITSSLWIALCLLGACATKEEAAGPVEPIDMSPPSLPGTAGSAAPSPMGMDTPPTPTQPSQPGNPEPPLPTDPDPPDPTLPDPDPPEPELLWDTLIEADWEVPPGEEIYLCARRTLTEDVFVSAFKALNPPGTHHTVLTVGDPGGEDGMAPCNSGVNGSGGVYGSGVGTDGLELPEGVAFPVRAGQQLVLNLHLFNSADEPLTGKSGTLVRTMQESEAAHLAEVALVTSLFFSIPPMQTAMGNGRCTMTHDVTAFAILPHMHTLGAHARVTVTRPEGVLTLHDQEFSFEGQAVYPIEPVELREGEVVDTECTWNNTTDRTVTFGESSLDEMCNVAVFRYPAGASPVFACGF